MSFLCQKNLSVCSDNTSSCLLYVYPGQGKNNELSVFLKISVRKGVETFGWIEHMNLFSLSHKNPLERSKEKWRIHELTRLMRKVVEKTPGMRYQHVCRM